MKINLKVMGCHTWCFSHIPEKEAEWNHEYAENIVNNCKEYIKMWKKTSKKYLNKQAKEENEKNQSQLNLYKNLEKEGKLQEIIDKYFEGNRQKYDAYIQRISVIMTGESLRQRQIKFEEDTLNEFNKYGEEHVIEFIENNQNREDIHTDDIFKFGLFILKDGKIYRDTTHYRGKKYGEDYVFEKQFSDIFRISDYDAEDCYSLEETLKRCEEYEIDWEKCYPNSNIKINNLDRIKEFWETYPDSIITFG